MVLAVAAFGCSADGTGTSQSAISTGTDGGGGPGRGHEPPAEALAACSGLAKDADCSFDLSGKTITGKCVSADPDGADALACMPPPPVPPQETIDACAGLVEDADCTFTIGDGKETISGKCHTAGPDGVLACGGRGGEDRGKPPAPPQEAIDACAGLTEGAACSVAIPDKDAIAGVCHAGPDGTGILACAPPPPAPPQEAIDACAGLTEGAACSVAIPDKDAIAGVCNAGPDGVLSCRPEKGPDCGPKDGDRGTPKGK